MNKLLFTNLIICLGVLLGTGCRNAEGHANDHDSDETHEAHGNHPAQAKDEHAHEDHAADEDHAAHDGEEPHDARSDGHQGHADHEGESGGHEGHDDESPEVVLSPKAMEIAGITIDSVKAGKISEIIELAGEVGLDEDRVADVVPRFPGIVKKVNKNLGDDVAAGEVVAVIESNESLSSYEIQSLISGTVIEKQITLGEFASEETTVYVIADLSSVWVNLAVYAKDVPLVRRGQTVKIEAIGHELATEGKISYIGSVYNEQTRSLTARVVLPNPDNKWHPGTFVRALIPLDAKTSPAVVSEEALQTIGESLCVFVPVEGEPNTFRPVEVEVAERDGRYARLVSGLSPGDEYVANGAYELKSKLITSSLGGHAGHGH